jgi:MFS family permease
MPSTLSILTNAFPAEERAKAIGIWSSIWGIGIVAGPVAGGLLLKSFSWGSVFLVNVPIVVAALVAAQRLVPESSDPETPPLDQWGALVSIAGLTALLWGGGVRMLAIHHVTYSINSLCHFFGRRPFATDDRSYNLQWLAPFTFGESWHNNHHAFPTSAIHGLRRWELDVSGFVITALEKVGLVWDVVRVDPARIEREAAADTV